LVSASQICSSGGGSGKISFSLFQNVPSLSNYQKIEIGYRTACPSKSGTYTYLTFPNLNPGTTIESTTLVNGCYDIIVKYTCANGCVIDSYLRWPNTFPLDCPSAGRGFRNLISTPAGGSTGDDDSTTTEPPTVSCAEPTNVAMTAYDDSVQIRWSPVGNAVNYRLYWKEVNSASEGDTGFVSYNWIIVEGSDTSAFIHGLDPCKEYEMGIVTQCDSSLSRWETVYVFNSLSSCKAPNDVLVYNVRSGQAQVAWSKIKGAERYTVKYRPKSGGTGGGVWTTFDSDTNDG
jgi:hypothetical protein